MKGSFILFMASVLYISAAANFLQSQEKDADREWKRCTDLSLQKHEQGKYEEGIAWAQKALEIARKHFGPKHPDTLTSICNLAVIYHNHEKYEEEMLLYEELLALRKQVLGDKHPDTLVAMNNLAWLYERQNKYEKALLLYEEVLALRKQVLGDKHPDTLQSMHNLAWLYSQQGKYEKAEILGEEAMALRKQVLGDKHPDTLQSMHNLALFYAEQGKCNKAEIVGKEAMALRKQVLGDKHPDTLHSMSNLAVFYAYQVKYEKAEILGKEAMALRKQVLGDKHPDTLDSMNNLAAFYDYQGKHEKALPLLEEVLALRKQELGDKHPDTLTSMGNLVPCYSYLGRYDKVSPLLEEMLALCKQVLGNKHPDTLRSMNLLSWKYIMEEKYEKALSLAQETLGLRRELLGRRHPKTLDSLDLLSTIYVKQKKYEKALPLLEEALALRKQVLGSHHPDTLRSMNGLVMFYDQQEEYEKARSICEETLALRRQGLGSRHPDTLWSINNLAQLYTKQGKYDKAKPLWKELLGSRNQAFQTWLWNTDEKTRASYTKKYSGHNLLWFYQETQDAGEALHFSLTRKGLLLRISSEINAIRSLTKDENLQKIAESLREKRSKLSKMLLSGATMEEEKSTLLQLEEEIERCERELAQKSESYARHRVVSLEKLVSRLNGNEAIVDFLSFQIDQTRYLMATVVDKVAYPGGILVPIPDFAEIEKGIQKYREQVINQDTRSLTILEETAQDLYRRLWKPLEKYVSRKEKIYLCLDGALHLLPFGALLDEKKKYLLEKNEFVTISSLPDLVKKRASKVVRRNTPVVFGNPDYGKAKPERGKDSPHDLFFSLLPGTREEAQEVSCLLAKKGMGCNQYLGKDASVTRLKQMVSPRILHIASHGYFLDESTIVEGSRGIGTLMPLPDFSDGLFVELHNSSNIAQRPKSGKGKMEKTAHLLQMMEIEKTATQDSNPLQRCGLAFAGANESGENLLPASEAIMLDLYGTELVVLSACDTGVGRVKQGEGVFSLRRAFEEAGAEAVLCTLWPTEDQATRIFMQKFYKKYLDGTPAHAAVRETQLEFLGNPKFQHPFYWAQFVMAGIPASFTPRPSRWSNYFIPSAIILALLAGTSFFLYYQRKKEALLRKRREERRKKRE